jgi:4-hydroxybenzoate polyprenyltransferase
MICLKFKKHGPQAVLFVDCATIVFIMSLPALLSLWFWVSRPLLYPLLPLLFLLGVQAGGGVVADFGWLDVLFVWALTWPLSMIIYGINDIYDYDTDRLDATRTRLDGAALTPGRQGAVWRGVAVASLVRWWRLVRLSYGWYGVGFAVTAIIVSVCYSVPPLRIKGRAPFDVLYSGFVHVCGMYSLGYWLVRPMTWPPLDIYILALAAVALHALGALRDYTADKASGNQTIAVRFGPRRTALLVMLG